MTENRTLITVAETIPELEKQLMAKQEAHENVKKEIKGIYRAEILGEQVDKVLRKTLEEKNLQLPHKILALAGIIEEAKEEILNLAQTEIEKIPKQIASMQASLPKKRESILHEFMEALERASLLHWQLNGARVNIPFSGKLMLPTLPQELMIESNARLDILFKGQPREGDPYATELKIRELKEKQAGGAKKVAEAVMVNARQ